MIRAHSPPPRRRLVRGLDALAPLLSNWLGGSGFEQVGVLAFHGGRGTVAEAIRRLAQVARSVQELALPPKVAPTMAAAQSGAAAMAPSESTAATPRRFQACTRSRPASPPPG